jgi:hypothetical protein
MALSKDAQEILVRAAEILSDPQNWVQGAMVVNKPDSAFMDPTIHVPIGVCMLGAMSCARRELFAKQSDTMPWDQAYLEAVQLVADVLQEQKKVTGPIAARSLSSTVANYNDNPQTTHADVKAVMCDAVKTGVHPDTTE